MILFQMLKPMIILKFYLISHSVCLDQHTKAIEELELEYEDEKNSMIAITESDGKTAGFLQGREFLAFGSLLNAVPEEDLYYANFGDPSVFKYFSKNNVAITNRKIGVLVAAYRRYYGNTWFRNGSHINELGYLLCGFPHFDLAKITPTVFKELTVDVLGRLQRCSVEQTKILYRIATHPDAYGAPYKWSSHELGRLNALFICIPRQEISSIQLEAITAITPAVIKLMDQKKLEYFTKQQILRMNPKTRRIYILRMQLRNSLDTSKITKKNCTRLKFSIIYFILNIMINGQRVFKKAPHAWHGPEPSRSCEVFIGRIPHDCFEDTLVPLFQQAGELFEFRLMINFSGWNRGYAFAMYTTEAEANQAICMFNNFMIRPSWQLGVCHSINNCRIFISRIPTTTSSTEIVSLLYALTEEVKEIRIRRSGGGCAAIVEYKSHRGAAMARKALLAAASAAWGSGARPAVDWSLPQSPHLLRQYREVGRWTPDRGVEIFRLSEEPAPVASSYSLERWSQARRLRLIHEAYFSYAAPNNALAGADEPQPTTPLQSTSTEPSANSSLLSDWPQAVDLLARNMLTMGLSAPWGTWGQDDETSDAPSYNPWTAPHPLHDMREGQAKQKPQ
ncbi:unnamed protein product [Leptosia nina]|uniref:RRM domain-containing protein n=1 Tax=Leptosia nina TaxID=320188 RepID=A0AAV1JDP0_9NEOP